jgi:hypothetical protein
MATSEQGIPTCPKCGKSDRVEPGGKPLGLAVLPGRRA